MAGLDGRDLGDVPSAADSFDEQDAGGHASSEDVHGSAFVRERGALRGGDFKIVCDAALVAIVRERKRVLGGGDCGVFGLGFFFQNAQGSEIVFHFLKRGENGLAIFVYGFIKEGFCLVGGATALASIEKRFRGSSGELPETAGALEQRADRRAFETAAPAERDEWKIGGAGDADLRVGFLHAAFGCGNIGTTLKQIGGKAHWERRRRNFKRRTRQRECGSRLAYKGRDAMFEGGALEVHIFGLSTCGFEQL